MIKHFCDFCEKPVLEFLPQLRLDFPDQKRTGVKSQPGSIGVTEGTWTPYTIARVVFELHDTPNTIRNNNPDICSKCVAKFLREIADNLKDKEQIS